MPFLADLWAHSASYLIGMVGGIVVMVIVWRSRGRAGVVPGVKPDTEGHWVARHTDAYGSQLRSIADIIQRAGFTSSVRGEGAGRFIYADETERAVEVYWDGAGFKVELFEQASDVSVRDYQQDTAEIATAQAVEWLSRHDDAD